MSIYFYSFALIWTSFAWGVGAGDTSLFISRGVLRGSIVNLETAFGVNFGELSASSDAPLETVPRPGGALLLGTESLDSHTLETETSDGLGDLGIKVWAFGSALNRTELCIFL